MRSRTAIWFECKIAYEKVMDDGLQKKVTESYVVDALSFTEAEKRIMEEMSSYISGNYLVQAGTLNGAVRNIDEVMGGTMIDYVIASVAETTLMDVFEYGKEKHDDKPEYEG